MARAGAVLKNPATGDRLTLLRTGAEDGLEPYAQRKAEAA